MHDSALQTLDRLIRQLAADAPIWSTYRGGSEGWEKARKIALGGKINNDDGNSVQAFDDGQANLFHVDD